MLVLVSDFIKIWLTHWVSEFQKVLAHQENLLVPYYRTGNSSLIVVKKVESVIRGINLYRMGKAIGFPNTYPLDSDLSGEKHYPAFEQLGPGLFFEPCK